MKMKTRFFAVVSIGLSMVATSLTPAAAFNVPIPGARPAVDVEQVQYRRPPPQRDVRRDRDRNRPGWYNGQRGSRQSRPGYRRHSDGFWYPLAAFAAGAIIGGAVNAPRPAQAMSQRHVQWCSSRYRTYRAYDNTYAPRVGVRAQCSSPYN
ncbi:BA14K family protein [Rhizobiaceae bacterium BDR2-2]|uniref:Lectin-like protein BA14k n=1 Tax=Ectorhizobium quercum TaxID=2965071 RepID=A0AAE3SUH5_9HYPH|nr:BA14K family protein [Ectorhizobium quercum]MCX8996009.1 BA14K family protein [Ectorhizobium quercum]